MSIEAAFLEFLVFCFPDANYAIARAKGHEFLDKELTEALFAQAVKAAEQGQAPSTATLTQQHELIRDPDEYGELFAAAAGVQA